MPFPPLSQDDLIALWRRILPRSYTRTIEESPEGFDLTAAQTAIFARAAEAANSSTQRLYIREHTAQTGEVATGGVFATTTLRITNGTQTPVVLALGTVLRAVYRDSFGDTQLGDRYVTTTETTLGQGITADVPVQAQRVGEHGNVPVGTISAFESVGVDVFDAPTVGVDTSVLSISAEQDVFTSDMIGRYIRVTGGPNDGLVRQITSFVSETSVGVDSVLLTGVGTNAALVEFADLGVVVEQPDAVTDGRDPWLDALGAERRVFRQSGESDEDYARRILAGADTVSPNAIIRAAQRILSTLGIGFRVLEARDPGPDGLGGAVWDVTAFDVDEMDAPGFPPDVLLYGSECGSRRFFVVEIDRSSLGEFGSGYDDGPEPPAFPNPGAWDLMAFDGEPSIAVTACAALFEQINQIRAAGVCFQIEVVDP